MTTEPTTTRALAACLTDVCERKVGPAGMRRPCGKRAGEHENGHSGHQYQSHTHSVECSARFWREFHGCDAKVWPGGEIVCCDYREDGERGWEHGDGMGHLADIIASPGTDEAWLAMRDILAEVRRRGWTYEITHDRAGTIYVGIWGAGDVTIGQVPCVSEADIPSALALAAWAASMEAIR